MYECMTAKTLIKFKSKMLLIKIKQKVHINMIPEIFPFQNNRGCKSIGHIYSSTRGNKSMRYF